MSCTLSALERALQGDKIATVGEIANLATANEIGQVICGYAKLEGDFADRH